MYSSCLSWPLAEPPFHVGVRIQYRSNQIAVDVEVLDRKLNVSCICCFLFLSSRYCIVVPIVVLNYSEKRLGKFHSPLDFSVCHVTADICHRKGQRVIKGSSCTEYSACSHPQLVDIYLFVTAPCISSRRARYVL